MRRNARGGCPNARKNARRMWSRSVKPVWRATTSIGCRLCSTKLRASSTRSVSIAFAGDWPVSAWKARLNRRLSKFRDGQRLMQIVPRIGRRRLNSIGLRREFQQWGDLRLAAGAAMMDDERASQETMSRITSASMS
jgi:hypothetical protein